MRAKFYRLTLVLLALWFPYCVRGQSALLLTTNGYGMIAGVAKGGLSSDTLLSFAVTNLGNQSFSSEIQSNLPGMTAHALERYTQVVLTPSFVSLEGIAVVSNYLANPGVGALYSAESLVGAAIGVGFGLISPSSYVFEYEVDIVPNGEFGRGAINLTNLAFAQFTGSAKVDLRSSDTNFVDGEVYSKEYRSPDLPEGSIASLPSVRLADRVNGVASGNSKLLLALTHFIGLTSAKSGNPGAGAISCNISYHAQLSFLSPSISKGSAEGLFLSWPTNFPGTVIETTTNVADPKSWVPAKLTTVITNGEYRAILNTGQDPSHVYRLRQ